MALESGWHLIITSLIITNIVTPFNLTREDQTLVNEEIKWLFAAADNFLKIYKSVETRSDDLLYQLTKKTYNDLLYDHNDVDEDIAKAKPKLWYEEAKKCGLVTRAIPSTAECKRLDNTLDTTISPDTLDYTGQLVTSSVEQLTAILTNLDRDIAAETQLGIDAKLNTALQSSINNHKKAIINTLGELANLFEEAYGVSITQFKLILTEYLDNF